MKIKKKVLAALTALSLAATCITPIAALADYDVTDEYPTTITLPNGEEREIPILDVTDTETGISTVSDDDTEEIIEIGSVEKFLELNENPDIWSSGKTFKITKDLDFSEVEIDEWYGLIYMFYGDIIGAQLNDDANNPVYPEISGIANNCSFIYAVLGGSIKNLTFKHSASKDDGSASFITFLPAGFSDGSVAGLELKNITVTGDISLTGSDQSNYSPFVYCVSGGGLTMENCVNKAAISGSIYGAVFHGCYPLYAATYTFKNCVNYGDITMQYAGMFFGNSSGLETKLANSTLTITGCANYGDIRGTTSSSYLVAPVASSGIGTVATQVESILNPEIADSTDSIPSTFTISELSTKSTDYGDGHLYEGNELTGFDAELSSTDSTSVVITRPDDESKVSYYVIAVSAYVNLWKKTNNTFDGTDRYTVKQKIGKTDFTTDTFEPTLKVYGFADSDVGTYETTIYSDYEDYDDYKVYSYNDKYYYRISDNMESSDVYALYVSSEIDEETNQPVGGGVKNAQIVTVSAYKADGTMLGCITINP